MSATNQIAAKTAGRTGRTFSIMGQDQFAPVFKAKLWKVKAEGIAARAGAAEWGTRDPTSESRHF